MKKFFPKNAKTYKIKTNKTNKTIKKSLPENSENNCKSLKEEFDFIIKSNYKQISAVERKQIWHNIILDLGKNIPFTGPLKQLIHRHIDRHIKKSHL